MRYLWTKPRWAFLLLVKVRLKRNKQWTIPVPLWALEETMRALQDIAWICEKLVRVWGRGEKQRATQQWVQYIATLPVSSTLQIGSDILWELRRYGRFRLVEVDDGETQVIVDVY